MAIIIKVLKQLNDGAISDKPVVIPTNADELIETDEQQALGAVTLIEEKRGDKLKTSSCANASKQK